MKITIPDDAQLLATFDAESRRPLHVHEIAERLELPFTARRPLTEALDAMTSRGLLTPLPGSRYRLPPHRAAEILGRYAQNPRGFGFVAGEDGGTDIYIPATSIGGAMHGDRVSVSAQNGPRGREGVVTRIVQRRPPRVPGVLRTGKQGVWCEPDDARMRGPLLLDSAGAAKEGDAIVAEITQWPERHGEVPEGRVLAVLGRPGQLDVEIQKVLVRESVEEDFSPGANTEADFLPEKLQPEDYEGREDLRDIPLVTIDPEDARDHDDAVHVRRRKDGGFVALIAIADVSYYVRPGTAIDADALSRGTSIYLPDRAIPMLPRKLSSHLASLIDDEDRLTLAVEVHLAADGTIEKSRFIEGVMRCRASLTYGNVARELGWSDLGKKSDAAERFRGDLEVAAELSAMLHVLRSRRGSLELDLPEARVKFAPDGTTPIDIVQSRSDPGMKRAYNLIEELMLLANEVVAQTCSDRNVPTIYRVHGGPDDDGLTKLATAANAFGYKLTAEDASKPKKLAAFVRKIQGTPHAQVLSKILLRSMPQALYHVDNGGHFGLAAPAYLHFTSPIRRYPDIVAHRVVRMMARKQRVPDDEKSVEAMRTQAAESSRLERRAMDCEREAMDLYRCVVAEAHVGEVHTGKVAGISSKGPFVQIESPFIDVLIRVQELGADDWEVDPLGISIGSARTGANFALGDELVIEISDVALQRRTVFGALPAETRDRVMGRGARFAKPKGGAKKSKGGTSAKGRKDLKRAPGAKGPRGPKGGKRR